MREMLKHEGAHRGLRQANDVDEVRWATANLASNGFLQ